MKISSGLIENCTFRDIKSIEDGDCIHVFGGRNMAGVWDDSPVRIDKCSFLNICHRAIKFQASDCHVYNCIINGDATHRPSAAIEVFGNRCSVEKTQVDLDYGVHALTVSGDDFGLKNCHFSVDVKKRHSEELTKLQSDVVFCVGERCVFDGNTFHGGYIGFYAPKAKSGLVVRNNTFRASLVRNIRLYDSASSNMVIESNTFEGNMIPIDLTGGQRTRIIRNKMTMPKSYISILGSTFDGEVLMNKTIEGTDIPVRIKGK